MSNSDINQFAKEQEELFLLRGKSIAEKLIAELSSINDTLIVLTKQVGEMNQNLKAIKEKIKG